MTKEHDTALAIAELRGEFRGEIEAIKARNEAMESRTDTRLEENKGAMDRLRADMATHREDAAKRETRLILAMAGMIALAVTILGLWLG